MTLSKRSNRRNDRLEVRVWNVGHGENISMTPREQPSLEELSINLLPCLWTGADQNAMTISVETRFKAHPF